MLIINLRDGCINHCWKQTTTGQNLSALCLFLKQELIQSDEMETWYQNRKEYQEQVQLLNYSFYPQQWSEIIDTFSGTSVSHGGMQVWSRDERSNVLELGLNKFL